MRALYGAGAVAVIAAVALLAFLLWPSGGARGGITDRALGAVGGGPVLHVITRAATGDQLVNLRTGRTSMPTYEVESWSDRSSRRFHDLVRRSGRIIDEGLSTHPADGAIDPASI